MRGFSPSEIDTPRFYAPCAENINCFKYYVLPFKHIEVYMEVNTDVYLARAFPIFPCFMRNLKI